MNKSTVRGASWIAAMAFVVAPPVQASPSPGDGPESMDRYAPVPEKPGANRATFDRPAITAPTAGGRVSAGSLSGKTVYVSAGHGWNFSLDAWRTQRGNTFDLVEDFITVETVDQYLIP